MRRSPVLNNPLDKAPPPPPDDVDFVVTVVSTSPILPYLIPEMWKLTVSPERLQS